MNKPILHLKKKAALAPTVTTVTVTGAKPAPVATGKPQRDNPVVQPNVDALAPEPPTMVTVNTTDTLDTTANDATAPALTLADLLPRFPACFDFERPPLKIGIHRDLVALGHPIKTVRIALSRYCTRPSYRRALVVDAVRVDLEGKDAGAVTAEEVESAKRARPAPLQGPRTIARKMLN